MRQKPESNIFLSADFLIRKSLLVFTQYTGICAVAHTVLSWHHSKGIRGSSALKAAEAYSQSVSVMRAFYSRHAVP